MIHLTTCSMFKPLAVVHLKVCPPVKTTTFELEVDNSWVYTPVGSIENIWFTHQWVVRQLSMLWFMYTSEVHINSRSSLSIWFFVGYSEA